MGLLTQNPTWTVDLDACRGKHNYSHFVLRVYARTYLQTNYSLVIKLHVNLDRLTHLSDSLSLLKNHQWQLNDTVFEVDDSFYTLSPDKLKGSDLSVKCRMEDVRPSYMYSKFKRILDLQLDEINLESEVSDIIETADSMCLVSNSIPNQVQSDVYMAHLHEIIFQKSHEIQACIILVLCRSIDVRRKPGASHR